MTLAMWRSQPGPLHPAEFRSPQRVAAGLAAERLKEHAVEPEIARNSELFDADRHGFVPGLRLCAVRAEQAVPTCADCKTGYQSGARLGCPSLPATHDPHSRLAPAKSALRNSLAPVANVVNGSCPSCFRSQG
jgi:hypothetical protein